MSFDPNDFLNQEYSEPNSTAPVPVPEGDYPATVSKITTREITRQDGTKALVSNILWALEDPEGKIEAKTNRKDNAAMQTLWLDVVMDSMGNITGLDMKEGMNWRLGLLREAVGLNGPGFSFGKLQGKQAYVRVKIEPDQNDNPRSNVTMVAKLSEGFGGKQAESSGSSSRRARRSSQEAATA